MAINGRTKCTSSFTPGLAATAMLVLFLQACTTPPPTTTKTKPPPISPDGKIHLVLGVPVDADSTDDYLIVRPQYALSYNRFRNVANWVAWNLTRDWFGSSGRYSGKYLTDSSLPPEFYWVTHSDYTYSGYNRGHIVRSKERTRTVEDNKSTFLLTNIYPQKSDLNQEVWFDFELWCENQTMGRNKELFIYAGGVFSDSSVTIGNGVTAPDSCFKIVVVLERGQGLESVTENTEVVSVMMPNRDGVSSQSWEAYKRTVDQIETATGYDFLPLVPDSIEAVIEAR